MLFWWLTLSLCFRPIERFSINVASTPFKSSSGDVDNALTFESAENDQGRNYMGVKTTKWESDLIPGQYIYVSSANFDDYLRELGVGFLLRRLARLASPLVTITKSNPPLDPDDLDCKDRVQWTIRTDTLVRSHVMTFFLDEPSTDMTMDGRQVSFLVKRGSESNELVEEQVALDGDTEGSEKALITTLVRRFSQEGMKVDMEVNNVTASSVFRRILSSNDVEDIEGLGKKDQFQDGEEK